MSFLVHGRRAMGPAYSLVILLIFSFGWVCLGQPLYVMIAPNILHLDNDESVYLEAHGVNGNVRVTIQIYDFPLKHRVFFYGTLNLDNNNNHQAIFKVKNLSKEFSDLLWSSFSEVRPCLFSYNTGYWFCGVQNSVQVKYRIFMTDTQVKAVNRILTVQVKNPEGIIVEQRPDVNAVNGIFSEVYMVPEVIKEGTWTMEAMLKDHPEDVFSTQFDVKKHVLPTFEVTLKPSKNFFHVDDKSLDVDLTAKYLFGEDVQGFAFVVFGVKKDNGEKQIFSSTLKRLELKLMNRVDHLIDFYSMDKELSRRGSLIIHIYKITRGGPNCIPLVLYKEFEVGLLQPASVTVYSYYNNEKHCTKFYHPTGNATQLATICECRVCSCAEQACPSLSKHTGDRESKACSTTTHVYMVKLKDIKRDELYDKYIMEIENIIKTGQDEVVIKDERSFLSHISCRKVMNLNVGSSYLVIGLPESMTRMPDGKYSYILSSDTWLERIPSKIECQTDQKVICDAIQEFEEIMLEIGCQI